jgi:hypothetical protein
LEVLDAVFVFASLYVPLVQFGWPVHPVGNHESGVGPLGHHFGLVDHPSSTIPAFGSVVIFRKQLDLLLLGFVALFGLFDQALGERLKTWGGNESYCVADAFAFAKLIQSRHRKSSISPQLYLYRRPPLLQTDRHPFENGHRRAA